MTEKTIMVCGAGGSQGGAVTAALLARGDRVRTLARSQEKQAAFGEKGIQAVLGDLSDPMAVHAACEGVDGIFFVLPLQYDEDQHARYTDNIIAGAQHGGVEILVFNTSNRIPEEVTDVLGIEVRRSAENRLRETGVPFISLHTTTYMENTTLPWSAAGVNEESVFRYPLPPDVADVWISAADAARFALAALDKPQLASRSFDVGGPQAVTGPEIAAAFSSALGREIQFESVPPGEFGAVMEPFVGTAGAESLAKLYTYIAAHPDIWDKVDDDAKTLLCEPQDEFSVWLKRQIPGVFR